MDVQVEQAHGWVGASGPVRHSGMWQQIHASVIVHADSLSFFWVLYHVNTGNEQADSLVEQGCTCWQ